MDTLRDRLAELADDAPTGGEPAAELWARGTRTHRLRAAALAAAVLVVGIVSTGIGIRLADGDGDHSAPAPVPASTVGISLPIQYPVGEDLPDLGAAPGPLAAIWLVPHFGGPPEAVGLVAETGTFGTLPIDLPAEDDPDIPENVEVALSPDGRRIAYPSVTSSLVVHDLVSGRDSSPLSEFETRSGYTWVDATHLVGHVAGGSDADGWVWEPGTTPKPVNPYPYLQGYRGRNIWVFIDGGGPRSCSSTVLADSTGRVQVPVLCDVIGFIGSSFVLGHWNSDRLHGDWNNPDDGNGTVVALNIRSITTHPFGSAAPRPGGEFDDPALHHVVVTAGAPTRVAFATDLLGQTLDTRDGAS
ncbi:MAG TPA: hypothetical protein VFN34_09250 [Ornithinibacter sp.]|nr:hypothetical protein [Ornithinibacter sp.]